MRIHAPKRAGRPRTPVRFADQVFRPKGLKSWDYPQEAFTGWAQAFRAYLDKVHAQ